MTAKHAAAYLWGVAMGSLTALLFVGHHSVHSTVAIFLILTAAYVLENRSQED